VNGDPVKDALRSLRRDALRASRTGDPKTLARIGIRDDGGITIGPGDQDEEEEVPPAEDAEAREHTEVEEDEDTEARRLALRRMRRAE
jgi:hypothetical protein